MRERVWLVEGAPFDFVRQPPEIYAMIAGIPVRASVLVPRDEIRLVGPHGTVKMKFSGDISVDSQESKA